MPGWVKRNPYLNATRPLRPTIGRSQHILLKASPCPRSIVLRVSESGERNDGGRACGREFTH